MLGLMGPAVISQSVLQVNLLVNQFFASFLATGYVTYLYYGNRLFQLPFGILGVSIATVTFPLLSRQANSGNLKAFSETLSQALAASLFFMVPCTAGIWIVATPACHLAFEYGRFTPEASQAVAEATALYALGLVGYSGVKILLPAYYAQRDAHRPLMTSIIAMSSNVGLNLTAFFLTQDSHLRFLGLVLASGLGSLINLSLLLIGLPKINTSLDWPFLGRELLKILVATFGMSVVAWASLRGIQPLSLPGARLFNFLIPVIAGGLVYFALAKALRMTGLDWVLGRRKRSTS